MGDTMYKFYCYEKCSTCKKAKKFLDNNQIPYEPIDIKTAKFKPEDIKTFHKKSGKELKKLFNTSGKQYRELNLKNKVDQFSEEEAYNLLSTNGMLLKRPILVTDDKVYIGFDADEYEELLS